MSEIKKLYFNDEYNQTQNVIDGRKTQMRKPLSKVARKALDALKRKLSIDCDRGEIMVPDFFVEKYSHFHVGEVYAVAQPLEVVWKQECAIGKNMGQRTTTSGIVECARKMKESKGWKNKMFAPASLMSYKVVITNVRVKNLRHVTEEDAKAEGCLPLAEVFNGANCTGWWHDGFSLNTCQNHSETFEALYRSIHGNKEWEADPICWVVDFKLLG